MAEAHFRFYAELNDFLPAGRRGIEFAHRFLEGATVMDRIESLGVPHTEVDLILIDGVSAEPSRRLAGGDRVSVYPVFEAFDLAGVTRIRPEPLRDPKFVLDVHLGRLATYLRVAGFDTLYRNCYTDEDLAATSRTTGRVLLTRDVGLLKRGEVTHGYFVRETDARRQFAEVIRRFHLQRLVKPFCRCSRCNGMLEPRSKEDVRQRLPARTAALFDDFLECPGCGRIFWKGSHYRHMRQFLESQGLY